MALCNIVRDEALQGSGMWYVPPKLTRGGACCRFVSQWFFAAAAKYVWTFECFLGAVPKALNDADEKVIRVIDVLESDQEWQIAEAPRGLGGTQSLAR